MKPRNPIGAMVLALSFVTGASGQEQFSFKLYLESLANGKKDTLELGISPDGYIGCDYQNMDAEVVFDPFPNQETHIGAFVTPDRQWNEERFQYIPNCMVFSKKGINAEQGTSEYGPLYDVCFLIPSNSLPVILRWDNSQIPCHAGLVDKKLMDGWIDNAGPQKTHYGTGVSMQDTNSFVLNPLPDDSEGRFSHRMPDSIFYQTFVRDSSGIDHGFRNLYLNFTPSSSNESNLASHDIRITPNPAKESFVYQSNTPLKEWKVYDISGRCILSGSGQQTGIDCSAWPSGMYVFEWVSTNGQKGNIKFIKQ